jgi:acetyl-CoA synthetase
MSKPTFKTVRMLGRPLPGIDAGIVQHHRDGTVDTIMQPEIEGELALRPGWPSMFRGYLHDEERYRKCFAGGWYLTGGRRRPEG